MGTFNLAIEINRPPADVFAFVADPSKMPLWYEAVEEVTPTTAGPTRAGARYRIIRSLPGGRAQNDVEITEYAPGHRVVLESREGPTPFRYRYDVEPRGTGTLLALEGTISSAGLPGVVARLDGPATRLFRHGMQQNLHELRRILETAHAVSSDG